ncbi:MAG: (2Fe-2S) ferredoxin domain-containing protein [Janthinobacterium lividum]
MNNPASPTPATPATTSTASTAAEAEKPYYEQHVFICINAREDGRQCCADAGALAAQKHAKKRLKSLDMNGQGRIRINQAGCLDRCEEGPVLVIYPQGTWYTYVDITDIDEIIDEHLIGGKVVERLKI